MDLVVTVPTNTYKHEGATWRVGDVVQYRGDRTDVDHGLTGKLVGIDVDVYESGAGDVILRVQWEGASRSDTHGLDDLEHPSATMG
ncbi:hypothetical protein [Streptomyces sp. NBC_01198]|uniref:hypothetical protein n=1 Tax=Streptomyces sp. NBC_01198 TaxID=2903769 RepID=UPI002E111CC2|nr:hypothetical protein OG702_32110 [Streptomyces sp. NBC_01198]